MMEFRLGGEDYALSKEDVEDRLEEVSPEDVRKHYVSVNGRRYPVKQALAAAIGRPVTDFITTDAIRVLSNLGFDVDSIKQPKPNVKTVSELLFEEYVVSKGLGSLLYEQEVPGTRKKPDYWLRQGGQDVLFEVKEFTPNDDDLRPGARAYDPYEPIREKINSAARQFVEFKQYCCCLVLFDKGKLGLDLSWHSIYAAMLGTPAIRVPFNPETGELDDASAYPVLNSERAKMVRSKGGQPVAPQNTTIAAIVVLEQLEVGRRRFLIEVERLKRDEGRDTLGIERFWRLIQNARGTERDVSLRQLRVVVCENPWARKRLPSGIFCGPYDEVYGPDPTTKDHIARLPGGEQISQILRLEAQEGLPKSLMKRRFEESARKRAPMLKDEAKA